jgi:hypothetical protein
LHGQRRLIPTYGEFTVLLGISTNDKYLGTLKVEKLSCEIYSSFSQPATGNRRCDIFHYQRGVIQCFAVLYSIRVPKHLTVIDTHLHLATVITCVDEIIIIIIISLFVQMPYRDLTSWSNLNFSNHLRSVNMTDLPEIKIEPENVA